MSVMDRRLDLKCSTYDFADLIEHIVQQGTLAHTFQVCLGGHMLGLGVTVFHPDPTLSLMDQALMEIKQNLFMSGNYQKDSNSIGLSSIDFKNESAKNIKQLCDQFMGWHYFGRPRHVLMNINSLDEAALKMILQSFNCEILKW